MNGAESASSHSVLWGGTLSSPINYNELGAATNSTGVMTGSNPDGTSDHSIYGAFCGNYSFSGAGSSVRTGSSNSNDPSVWLGSSGGSVCSSSFQLYCISQYMPSLTSFTASTGAAVGQIDIAVGYPTVNANRVSSIVFRRRPGIVPPLDTCNDASDAIANTLYTMTDGTNSGFIDTVGDATATKYFSYRACVYSNGTLHSSYTATASPNGSTGHIAFTTREVFLPDLTIGYRGDTTYASGIIGADARCQSEANINGFGGTWKAIISDSTYSASGRINLTGTVSDSHGSVISTSANFWTNSHVSGIRFTEYGIEFHTAGTPSRTAWTGTASDGTVTASTCSDWSNGTNAAYGTVGLPWNADGTWSTDATSAMCDVNRSLYCISQ